MSHLAEVVHIQNRIEMALKMFSIRNYIQEFCTQWVHIVHWCFPDNNDLVWDLEKSLEIFLTSFARLRSGAVGTSLSSVSYHILITRERKEKSELIGTCLFKYVHLYPYVLFKNLMFFTFICNRNLTSIFLLTLMKSKLEDRRELSVLQEYLQLYKIVESRKELDWKRA